jgi:poly(3-hydroxybutyrate) depolymerase
LTVAVAVLLACGGSGGSSDNPKTTHTVTVTKAGAGAGTVSSTVTGIDCGAACSASFDDGTSVTLTAKPDTGSAFTGWGGACSGTSTRCTLTLTADQAVTASFGVAKYGLIVNKAGTGLGTVAGSGIDCGLDCDSVYDNATDVTLTATPRDGATFDGWSGGGCTGTGSCVVHMTARQAVTATFTGGGAGAVKSTGCDHDRTLVDGSISIGARSYILKTPASYDKSHPYRLVIAYHQLNGTAASVAAENFYGLSPLANDSTIFVAPLGNTDNPKNVPGWQNANDEDVLFTDALLAQVESDLCIDTTRVFATGWSWGSAMSHALACERGDVVRGVALYSFGKNIPDNQAITTTYDTCPKPVAYWAAHGLSDSVLSITSGRVYRDEFVALDGCTAQTPPEPAAGSGTHTCTQYQGCSAGHPVTWCAFDGGHMWNPLDAGQVQTWVPTQVWDFFNGF